MEPLGLKGLLNPSLSVLILKLPRIFYGSPGGHADFDSGLPGLQEDSLERVLAVEVPSASFGPKIIKDQAPKDIERLSPVGEAARVVAVEVRRVVLLLKDNLSEEDEGVQSYREYYKGEGGGFPRVRAVVSQVSPSRPWLVPTPKRVHNEF